MAQIPAHRRPHYPPTERMAILQLKAARGWNQVQTLPNGNRLDGRGGYGRSQSGPSAGSRPARRS
jgi:hypothetical protein